MIQCTKGNKESLQLINASFVIRSPSASEGVDMQKDSQKRFPRAFLLDTKRKETSASPKPKIPFQ